VHEGDDVGAKGELVEPAMKHTPEQHTVREGRKKKREGSGTTEISFGLVWETHSLLVML